MKTKTMFFRSLMSAMILSAGFAAMLCAESPVGKISYQGRLTDSNNQPLTGSFSIRFSIWDTGPGSGGTELWNETQVLSVDRGLVSAELGSVSIIPGSLFMSATTFLEIKVGADPAMTPRIRLLASPYAFNTNLFDGNPFSAVVATFSAQTVGGNKTFTGTVNPGANLSVGGAGFGVSFASNVTVSGAGSNALTVSGGIVAGSGLVNIVDATGRIPSLTGTTLANLDGSALTNLTASILNPGSTNYIQNRNTLQSGATFFVSSGTVQGTLTSPAGFVGVGSTLTFLNASNLALGTVPNARIDPTSVAKYNASGLIDDFRINPSSIAKYNAGGFVDNFRLDPSSVTLFGPVRSRSIIGVWARINMAATLTNSQFTLVPLDAATNAVAANSSMPMPFDGIIRGVIVAGSAARTAGTATFQVFVNGADPGASPDAVIDATNTQYVASSGGNITFTAGQRLDVRVTTTGTWAPVTAEWFAHIIVEWTN